MTDIDLNLPSGRLRARRWGADGAPLLLCLPGLSANLVGFTWLAERLAGRDRQVVALDLRGRGKSEISPPGSYGTLSHARDVLDAAVALGAETFGIAGWSLGALVGMRVAELDPARVRSLALIDHTGPIDRSARDAVVAGLARLGAVVPKPDTYVHSIRATGSISPWSRMWDDYYRHELAEQPDGRWRPSTSKDACLEDLAELERADWTPVWPLLTMPVALIRAREPLGGGHVVPEDARDAFLAAVPHATLTETDAGHFTVLADDATLSAIQALP